MKEKRLAIFLLDGFAYDYLKTSDFLSSISTERVPLETLLGYSSTIIPALWSGKYPEETGIWTEFYYAPRRSYRLLKMSKLIPSRRLEFAIKNGLLGIAQTFGGLKEISPGIPDSIECLFSRNNIRYWDFPPIEMKCETFDKTLKRFKVPYHFEFHKHSINRGKTLRRLRRLTRFNRVFIYYIGTVDAAGHAYGPSPSDLRLYIDNLENLILDAYEILAETCDVDIVVFSDHGMTKIVHRYDLLAALRPQELGKDYVAFVDSTLARFWCKNEGLKDELVDVLNSVSYGHVLSEEEKERYRLRFRDNRYGDAVFIADPGIELFPNFMSPIEPIIGHMNEGMHGYAPEDSSTRGIFIYCGERNLQLQNKIKATEVLVKLSNLLDLESPSGNSA
jgi:predicted AlkP superfamily pyrophosphatase or phosphodiesterase